MANVLIVDDEEAICWGLGKVVEGLGHTPIAVSSAEAALQLEVELVPSAIVLDVRLPGMSGLEAMAQLRQHFGGPPIIVITAYGDLETAATSLRTVPLNMSSSRSRRNRSGNRLLGRLRQTWMKAASRSILWQPKSMA